VPGRADTTPHGPLLTSGFHDVKHADGEWTLAASLVAPPESLAPAASVLENARPIASGQSPAYWLLALALAVLVAESMLYHRRKVG
jgi:hypothetical protein